MATTMAAAAATTDSPTVAVDLTSQPGAAAARQSTVSSSSTRRSKKSSSKKQPWHKGVRNISRVGRRLRLSKAPGTETGGGGSRGGGAGGGGSINDHEEITSYAEDEVDLRIRRSRGDDDDDSSSVSDTSGELQLHTTNDRGQETANNVRMDDSSSPALSSSLATGAPNSGIVLERLEGIICQVCLFLGAYLLGVYQWQFAFIAGKALEYCLVALGTCLVVRLASSSLWKERTTRVLHRVRRRNRQKGSRLAVQASNDDDQFIQSLESRQHGRSLALSSENLAAPITPESGTASETAPKKVDGDYQTASGAVPSVATGGEQQQPAASMTTEGGSMPHPALEPYYVIDTSTNERVSPNSTTPHKLDNDYFTGEMMVLIRTPNIDDPANHPSTPETAAAVSYLSSRTRRFEFQFQVRLKKVPTGRVYFACELQEAVKMGMIQRAFVSAAMAFVRTTNSNFHYSMTGQAKREDGAYEQAHMAFPVEDGMNRVVATPPDQEPPILGQEIIESPESVKRRKKGERIDWNLQDTYTLSLWSAYVDFLMWRCINLPGIRPFDLSMVMGKQPVYLTLFEIPEDKVAEKYYLKKDLTTIVELEMCNSAESAMGPAAKKWATRKRTEGGLSTPKVDEKKELQQELLKEIRAKAADAEKPKPMSEFGVAEEDAVAELGEGIYVRSGDSINLREASAKNEEGDGASSNCYVTSAGGFCVLQEQSSSKIIIEKVGRSNRRSDSALRSPLIKSGDNVIFKLLRERGPNEEPETLYLSTHRGWWLKWVASVPTKNGFFTVHTHETEYSDDGSVSHAPGETQSSYLTLGGSFYLQHKRWSKYHVGVCPEGSVTYGGRLMGLYTPQNSSGGRGADFDDEDATGTDETESQPFTSPVGMPEMPTGKKKSNWLKPLQLCAYEPTETLGDTMLQFKLSGDSEIVTEPVTTGSTIASSDSVSSPLAKKPELTFSSEHLRMDVPAWVEMMNRDDRIRQLVYVVRVAPQDSFEPPSEQALAPKKEFSRLRTGKELAPVMRAGFNWRNNSSAKQGMSSSPSSKGKMSSIKEAVTPPAFRITKTDRVGSVEPLGTNLSAASGNPSRPPAALAAELSPTRSERRGLSPTQSGRRELSPVRSGRREQSPMRRTQAKLAPSAMPTSPIESSQRLPSSETLQEEAAPSQATGDDEASIREDELSASEEGDWMLESGDDLDIGSVATDADTISGESKQKGTRSRKLFNKLAKTVTSRTAHTGKTVIRQGAKVASSTVNASVKMGKGTLNASVKVGKNTVNAGKAIIGSSGRRPQNPPHKEPKSTKGSRRENRKKERGLHTAVTKSMKKIAAKGLDQDMLGASTSGTARDFLAGTLSPPEQSCRTVSSMLSQMSSVPPTSSTADSISALLSSQVDHLTNQDKWFLSGGATVLGVVRAADDLAKHGGLRHDCLVARCLWESHWREEWCGLYDRGVAFYGPLTNEPCLEVSFADIKSVRTLEVAPIPGYPVLVVETAWTCHYLALANSDSREAFRAQMVEALAKYKQAKEGNDRSEIEQARFWQGLQSSIKSSSNEKWDTVSSANKKKSRVILNSRRMVFDVPPPTENPWELVEELLSTSLAFSFTYLTEHPEALVQFLDRTSQLRNLPLQCLDLATPSAFCFFVNLYHCLLQHTMLFSVHGPLNKRSYEHFMRTSCYEVGGEVFSLAELQSCVIRGNMSRPINPKPPFITSPRKSDAYRFYALGYTTPSVNFVLNTGATCCPREVPILTTENLDTVLPLQATEFLNWNMVVDVSKKTITLPKVCEAYRNDFTKSESAPVASSVILRCCLPFLAEEVQAVIRQLLLEKDEPSIRFNSNPEQYHTTLTLREFDVTTGPDDGLPHQVVDGPSPSSSVREQERGTQSAALARWLEADNSGPPREVSLDGNSTGTSTTFTTTECGGLPLTGGGESAATLGSKSQDENPLLPLVNGQGGGASIQVPNT